MPSAGRLPNTRAKVILVRHFWRPDGENDDEVKGDIAGLTAVAMRRKARARESLVGSKAMTRTTRRAFTLVELIVVIAIIGILVGLLMPGIGSAWQVAQTMQCQTNLTTLYKAQTSWNADREAVDSTASAWAALLGSYLEGRVETLRCPSAVTFSVAAGEHGPVGPTTGGGGSDGSDDGGYSMDNSYVNPENTDIQLQDVTIGVTDEMNNTLYEIPLTPSPFWSWFQSWTLPDGRTHIGANLDNYFPKDSLGRYTDEDFLFVVTYSGSSPSKVEIGDCDGSANRYWTDFRLNHKPIWNGERFLKQFGMGHYHEVVDVKEELAKQNTVVGTGPKQRIPYSTWTIMSSSKSVLGATSYGLNRGSYEAVDAQNVTTGRKVAKPDPKLIFLLDYPKAIADMTDIGDNLGEKNSFDYIFIQPTPPTNWRTPPDLSGRTWEECQALRHFGKANVLFCDGHIESLEKGELDWRQGHSDLWNYQGR
jgi:prepilin-type N-terminal cleavage/methylation domain-containing protein/prepilin-type processing-associated H-X9-DG protein